MNTANLTTKSIIWLLERAGSESEKQADDFAKALLGEWVNGIELHPFWYVKQGYRSGDQGVLVAAQPVRTSKPEGLDGSYVDVDAAVLTLWFDTPSPVNGRCTQSYTVWRGRDGFTRSEFIIVS